MPKITLPLTNGHYNLDSPLSAQECVNVYPVLPTTESPLSTGALYRTPGISQLTVHGFSGTARGAHKDLNNGQVYFVTGDRLYRQNNLVGTSFIGNIDGEERVIMADNGETLVIIVPGITGYFYQGGVLEEIDDPVFDDFKSGSTGGVRSVCVKDGRFVYTTYNEFFLGSNATVNFGKDFDALDFEDAEVKPDKIQIAANIRNELYIFGTDTIELYQNVGGSDFPFTRIPGATIDKGTVSPYSVVEFDNTFFFIGRGKNELPAVWRGGSGSATKISTDPIDRILQAYFFESGAFGNYELNTELADVVGWAYTDNTGYFLGFNLPNETIVYDQLASTLAGKPIWHIRKSDGSRWRPDDIIPAFGANFVNDYTSNRIGRLSRDFTEDFFVEREVKFTTPVLQNDGETFIVNSVELKTNSGNANPKGQDGDEPQIRMEYSLNGGETWIDAGERALGRAGNYDTRQIWRRIGRVPYSIIFRFSATTSAPCDYYKVDVEINGGR